MTDSSVGCCVRFPMCALSCRLQDLLHEGSMCLIASMHPWYLEVRRLTRILEEVDGSNQYVNSMELSPS
jgi:hypothetical protein